ncbi:myo-inositol-1(or 4)-monophosphatase [Nitrosospira sp. Nl5]|uniref:inositol monophosphatase family protein n=1 Tax=Nitrosospira sp. Nl5 TaxID=200120 RepID=UPI00089117D6|nr:inositol monophosphatase family protein [Nitrosospira sp. Nl5]SCY30938.1 myo-inositol-1(or 4)-monophosphatase [Nitrosospira sp. Nl5]
MIKQTYGMENLKIKTSAAEDFSIEEIEKIAKSAGDIVMAHYARGAPQEFKSARQVVTGADKESEQLLKEQLLKIYSCPFYGEEGGGDIAEHGDQWVVDPLDGTENMRGYPPLLAVSVGLLRHGIPVLGVVYDPIHAFLYSAQEGRQTRVNGEVTQIGSQGDPEKAIVGLDFSSKMETRSQTLEQLSRVLEQARAVKVFGAPALSLAAVAAGRLDLFFRPSTKPADTVAGVCLVRESGGKVVDYDGMDWTIRAEGMIAGSSGMVDAYLPYFR